MPRNWIINTILILSMIGMLDSGYLVFNHFQGGNVGCFLVHGCDIVLTSEYSDFFGIPVSLFGFLYYLAIFVTTLYYNFNRKAFFIKLISKATVLGFLVSIWLLYVQMFLIKSFCSYCLVSAVTSTSLFLLGMCVIWRTVDLVEGEVIES